jgi:hypothetical protein
MTQMYQIWLVGTDVFRNIKAKNEKNARYIFKKLTGIDSDNLRILIKK